LWYHKVGVGVKKKFFLILQAFFLCDNLAKISRMKCNYIMPPKTVGKENRKISPQLAGTILDI
jgi:hypothetical protein